MNATSANSGVIMKTGKECQHCGAQETPQWREGPLGPKTLCNACGMRYRSGRLVPEYRPAKSPTFCSDLHSNSHKQVLQMRSTRQPMWMFEVEPDNKGSVEIGIVKFQGAGAIIKGKPKSQGADATAQKELKSQATQNEPKFQGADATAQKEPESQGADATVQKEPESQGANATIQKDPKSQVADAAVQKEPESQGADATAQNEPKSQGADATVQKEPKSQGADATAQKEPKSQGADASPQKEPKSQDAISTVPIVKKEYRHRRAKETPKWWQRKDTSTTPKTMRKECRHPRAKESPQLQERQDSSTTTKTVKKECQHCRTNETPQWREGPLGANTLCNACGLRYRSGRLFPEYRPAKSPTFSSELHSNSDRQIFQRRSTNQPMEMIELETDDKGKLVGTNTRKSQDADAVVNKKPKYQNVDFTVVKEETSVEGNLHPLSYEGFRLRDFCMKLNQLKETEGRSESLFWEKNGKINI